MARSVQPPAPSTRTLDMFYGMVTDRSGLEVDEKEFTDLINIRVNNLRQLKVRNGAKDFSDETHTGSATGVNGLERYVNESGTEIDLKILDSGVLFESTSGGTWTSLKTGLANARTFFAELSTEKTGVSADATDTVDSSSVNTVTASSLGATINEHVGKILQINNERKVIVKNTATKVTVAERFDVTPAASDSFSIIPAQKEMFFANGTNFYKTDGTTNTRLDNRVYAKGFTGITEHNSRLWAWKGRFLYYSDANCGEHYSRNALLPFSDDIQIAHPLGGVIAVWEKNKVSTIKGNRPDEFDVASQITNRGTSSPFSVATWGSMQMGLNKEQGVMVISTEKINPDGIEPSSVSNEYITEEILAHTDAQLNAACAETANDKYYLYVGTDLYVLHLKESLKAPRDDAGNIRWVWTVDDYPTDVDAFVLRLMGTKLAAGSAASGQVYELEADSQYTDDGTAIAATIEKQHWRPMSDERQVFFWGLKTRQNTTPAQVNVNYFADPDGTTYGSAIEIIDLNAASTSLHTVKFTGNPSNDKSKGNTMSLKITTSTSINVPGIEELHLLYMPNPIG